MADSLPAHQVEQVLELGAWRDQGHRFAVGLHGEVSKYHEEKEEQQDEPGQRQRAAASAAPASSSASDAEPASTERRQTLVEQYLGFRPEILLYYPSASFRAVDDGLWLTARICPLGLSGPAYWVCLLLPDNAVFCPKGFAFSRVSPMPKPVGLRHTNFPDGSICAFTDDDDAWRPGDSPKILLNLYADWLVCQLFLKLQQYWPGPQFGPDASYRLAEFKDQEWCHCGSRTRYGDCHRIFDFIEVQRLKALGKYVPLSDRVVPTTIVKFAKSGWKRIPDLNALHMHPYFGQAPRR